EAAEALAKAGPNEQVAAGEALLGALAVGLAPQGAQAALAALAAMKRPIGLDTLRLYRTHRRPKVRTAALDTLLALHPGVADDELLAALGDPERSVRAHAGELLAGRGVRKAVEPLLALLRRGEEWVPSTLGTLGDADLARRVGDLIGTVPDPLVARTLA